MTILSGAARREEVWWRAYSSRSGRQCHWAVASSKCTSERITQSFLSCAASLPLPHVWTGMCITLQVHAKHSRSSIRDVRPYYRAKTWKCQRFQQPAGKCQGIKLVRAKWPKTVYVSCIFASVRVFSTCISRCRGCHRVNCLLAFLNFHLAQKWNFVILRIMLYVSQKWSNLCAVFCHSWATC